MYIMNIMIPTDQLTGIDMPNDYFEPNTWNFFQMLYKKGTRKILQTLQPSGVDKENLVGTDRFHKHKYEFIFRFLDLLYITLL